MFSRRLHANVHFCSLLVRSNDDKIVNDGALSPVCGSRETKIVLRGETTLQLQQLGEKAKSAGLPHYLVHDAGHTQVSGVLVVGGGGGGGEG